MNRIRTAILLTAAAAAAIGAIAPAASAAATPLSKVKADMGYLKTVENAYSKAHHAKAKAVLLEAGQVTHVGKHRVSARPQEQITVQPGHEGKKLGYCATISYFPYHRDNGLHFAYYDSILKLTVWKSDGYKVGGACFSHAKQQSVITGQMRIDVFSAVDVEQDYTSAHPGSFGVDFTANDMHVTTLPNGDIISTNTGDTLRGYANPTRHGYCIVVTNPVAKLAKHSYHYSSSTRHSAPAGSVDVKQGVFGDDKTGACALPVK